MNIDFFVLTIDYYIFKSNLVKIKQQHVGEISESWEESEKG